MQTVETNAELRDVLARWRAAGETVAFVPTMGHLHEGHLALVRDARARAARCVVSIYVNPTQFAPGEDYADYPRTLEADRARLEAEGVDLLYAPVTDQLYPHGPGNAVRVEVPGLADTLCGAHRPGHFTGVATVVAKLLALVRPDVAVFGQKDYQQLLIVRRLVEDLLLPVRIESVPTVREADGLALSSRNAYLDAGQRERAAALYRTLRGIAERIRAGAREWPALEQEGAAALRAAGLDPDYVAVRRAADLAPPGTGDRHLAVLAAARLGAARLIDNVLIDLD